MKRRCDRTLGGREPRLAISIRLGGGVCGWLKASHTLILPARHAVANANRLVGARKAVPALLERNCLKAAAFETAFQLVESCSRAALSESCSKAV